MNPSTTGSIKPSASTTQASAETRRSDRTPGNDADTTPSAQDRNAFSQSLRAKERQLVQEREQFKPDTDGPDQLPLQMMAQRSTPSVEAVHPSARGVGYNAAPSVTNERLALTSTLDNPQSAQQAGLKSAETAQIWQASLPGANGSSLQFTASYQPSSHASPAMWAVSVASPAAEAAAFARQANRLSDRLQDKFASRGVGLRVEVQSDEAAPTGRHGSPAASGGSAGSMGERDEP